MKLQLLTAQPAGAAPLTWGLLRLTREPRNGTLVVTLHWRRLLLLGLLSTVVAWAGISLLAHRLLHRRGFGSVTLTQVALPWRWHEMRRAQSTDLVRMASGHAERNDHINALWCLIGAVRRDPSNRDAHFGLGQLFARNLLMSEAVDRLLQGLAHIEPDYAYLQLLLDSAAAADDLETTLSITQRYWEAGWQTGDAPGRIMLASRRGLALLQLERWHDALAWAREVRDAKGSTITLLDVEAYALLKLGRAEEARALLSRVPVDFAQKHDYLVHFFAEVLYHAGDKAAFRNALLFYVQLGQGSPVYMLDTLKFCHDKPDLTEDYQKALRAYYTRYGSNENALAMLCGQLLSQHGTAELHQLREHVRERGFNSGRFDLAYAESLVFDGRFSEAGTVLDTLPRFADASVGGFKISLLRRIVTSLSSTLSNATAPLLEFVGQRRLPLADSLGLASLLSRRGLYDDAATILDQARRAYPRSRRVTAQIAQLEAERTERRQAGNILLGPP